MNERNKLQKLLYETDDPAKKLALSKRMVAMDAAQADSAVDAMVDALDKPKRLAKEAISGDPEQWYGPEGMPEWAYAAGNTALDIVADPLNAVGGGLATLGKAGAKLPGAIASMSNYIPDWYAPSALKKAIGVTKWAGDTAGSMAKHITSPKSRALYAEQKVTTPAQDRVAKLLSDKTDTRATEKGVSQVQYTSRHIPTQAEQEIATAPAAKEIIDRSFLGEGSSDLSSELQKHSVKADTTGTLKQGSKGWDDAPEMAITPDEADYVAKYAGQRMPGDNDYVIKSPVAKETGGHHNDVVYKNPAKKALSDAFKNMMDADGNVNLKQLYGWLEQNKPKYNKQLNDAGRTRDSWGVINSSADDVAKNGLWLQGSKLGSAITEGGVSWMMKVEPDGTLKAFMMDKHDFMEKVPLIKHGMKKVIPKDTVAVTPMMANNIKNIGGGTKRQIEAPLRDAAGKPLKEGRKTLKKAHKTPATYQQTARRGTKDPYRGLLEEYTKINPSTRGTARETAALVGEGLLAQRAYENTGQ